MANGACYADAHLVLISSVNALAVTWWFPSIDKDLNMKGKNLNSVTKHFGMCTSSSSR